MGIEKEKWREEVDRAGSPSFLLVGHTHLPGKMRIGKTVIVNPGSVGQPKDGDPRAAYAIWEDGDVSLRRAEYDVEETVRAYPTPPFLREDVASLAHVLRTGGELPQQQKAELRP